MSEFPQRKRWVKQVDKRSLHLLEMSDESEQDMAEVDSDKNGDKCICSSETNDDIASEQICSEKTKNSEKSEHIVWGNINQSVSSYFGPSVLEEQEHDTCPSVTSGHTVKPARPDVQENAAIFSDGGGRMQSPSSVSSITSCKRLEWDSGADVGYGGNEIINDQVLSTIERLALAQGCSAMFSERVEPDDKSSPAILQNKEKLTPLAHSTPHEDPIVHETIVSEVGTLITPIILHTNLMNDNCNERIPHTTSKCDLSPKKDSDVKANSLPTKLSNTDEADKCKKSFENTEKHAVDKCMIQRSHSDLCLNKTKNYVINDNSPGLFLAHKFLNENIAAVNSGSSSSVSTVVHQKAKSLKNQSQKSVGIQVDAVTTADVHKFIVDTPVSSKFNAKVGKCIFQSSKLLPCNDDNTPQSCADQHQKSSHDIITEDLNCSKYCDQILLEGSNKDVDPSIEQNTNKPINSVIESINKRLVQVCGTIDSASSSTQTATSWCRNERKDQQISSGVIGSANSFEYLPGHVYEKKSDIHANSLNEKLSSETSRSTSSELCSAQIKPDESGLWSSASSTLSRDLEKSIKMLQKLLDGRKDDPRLKNKLIGMVVNRLVNTNYKHDSKEFDSLCSSNSQQKFKFYPKNGTGLTKENFKKPVSSSSANSSELMNETLRSRARGIKQGGKNRTMLESTSSGSISIPLQAGGQTETSNSYCNSSTSSTVRRRHWEEPATLSERKLDTSGKNQEGVYDYCEMERAHQLSWIEYEIEQLSNLKRFLKNKNDSKVNKTKLTNGTIDSNRSQKEKHVSSTESVLNSRPGLETSRLQYFKDKGAPLMGHVPHSKPADTEIFSSQRTNEKYSVKMNESDKVLLHSENLFQTSDAHKNRRGHRDIFVDMKVRAGNKTIIKVLEKAELLSDTLTSCSASDSSKIIVHNNDTQTSDSSSSGIINVYSETVGKYQNSTYKQIPKNPENIEASTSHDVMCCCECKEELDWIREYRKLLNDRVLNRKMKKCVHKSASKSPSDRKSPHEIYKIYKGKVINGSNTSSRPLSKNTVASSTLSETDTDAKVQDISKRMKANEDKITQPYTHKNPGNEFAQAINTGSQESLSFRSIPDFNGCEERKAKSCHSNREENSEKKSCPCCRNVDIDLDNLQKENYLNRNEVDNEMNKNIPYINDACNDATTVAKVSTDNFLKQPSDTLATSENTSVAEIIETEPKRPQPIAYILTFETDIDNTILNKSRERKKSLDEVKVRIPAKKVSPYKQTTLKGKSNIKMKLKVRGQHPKKNNDEDNENECPNGDKPLKKLTLQECLFSKRPDYIKNAEERKRCLTEWAKFREDKQNNRQKLLTLGIVSTAKTKPENNPIFTVHRILSQKEMRKLTELKYRRLPEVVEKKTEIKRKREYRTNKLMAEIFTKEIDKVIPDHQEIKEE